MAGLVAEGHSAAAIAEARSTSVETARTQIKTVLSKTGSASRTELVLLAVRVDLPIDRPGP